MQILISFLDDYSKTYVLEPIRWVILECQHYFKCIQGSNIKITVESGEIPEATTFCDQCKKDKQTQFPEVEEISEIKSIEEIKDVKETPIDEASILSNWQEKDSMLISKVIDQLIVF